MHGNFTILSGHHPRKNSKIIIRTIYERQRERESQTHRYIAIKYKLSFIVFIIPSPNLPQMISYLNFCCSNIKIVSNKALTKRLNAGFKKVF